MLVWLAASLHWRSIFVQCSRLSTWKFVLLLLGMQPVQNVGGCSSRTLCWMWFPPLMLQTETCRLHWRGSSKTNRSWCSMNATCFLLAPSSTSSSWKSPRIWSAVQWFCYYLQHLKCKVCKDRPLQRQPKLLENTCGRPQCQMPKLLLINLPRLMCICLKMRLISLWTFVVDTEVFSWEPWNGCRKSRAGTALRGIWLAPLGRLA